MDTLIYQTGMIEYIEKYPNSGVMIPVHGHTRAFGTDAYFQCRLCSYETAAEEMTTDNTNRWDSVTPGLTQYGFGENAEIIYSLFNNNRNMEPFAIERDFYGLGVGNDIEIVEEFRLLNNLYFERSRNEYRDLEADTVVVKIEGDFVSVNRKYLKRYLVVKNMVMLVHIDSIYRTDRFDPEIKPQYEEHSESDDKIYTITFGVQNDFHPKRNFSLLYLKTLIRGFKLEECGYWPYNEVERKLLKKYKRTKYLKLIFAIMIDLLGNASYLFPVLGESGDLVWGLVSGVFILILFPNHKITAFGVL